MKGVVSKETVVLRRWGSSIQKFGFINSVDKTKKIFHLLFRHRNIFPRKRDVKLAVICISMERNTVTTSDITNKKLDQIQCEQFWPKTDPWDTPKFKVSVRIGEYYASGDSQFPSF